MKFKHVDTCWYFNKIDHRGKPYDWPCCGEITECDDEFVKALQDENVRLREALKSLSNEASGLIYAHEFALSMDGGNSNMQVLRIRLEEARAALEGK